MTIVKKKLTSVIKNDIQPLLQEHGGGLEVVSYEDKRLGVKLIGSCVNCPHLSSTFEGLVKKIILEKIPEIEEIVLIKGVSEDLLDMARNILNKNIKTV